MRKIYLLSTDHLEDSLWFRDEEDFKVAMNYVAIGAVSNPNVSLLAFVLKEFLRRNYVDIRHVPYEDEAVERAIAYVQMNCVAANICSHPAQWPWGTGNTFFNQSKPSGIRIGDMSKRTRHKLFHSFCPDLPEEWIVCNDGFILPSMYVDIKTVEKCFRTPKRFNYFLFNSSKARKRVESAGERLPAFKDQTILSALPDLCRSLFQKDTFVLLSLEEQAEMVRQIRYRFSADAGQIARVCGLTYADSAKLLDLV